MGDFHHGRGCEQRQRDYLTRWQPSPEEPERTRASPEARAEPWRDIIPRDVPAPRVACLRRLIDVSRQVLDDEAMRRFLRDLIRAFHPDRHGSAALHSTNESTSLINRELEALEQRMRDS